MLARDVKLTLDTHRFVLKPYVFAAHRYNVIHAPILLRNLPRAAAPGDYAAPAHEYHGIGMIERVEHLGRTLRLSCPLVAPPAIMLFARLVEPDIVGGQLDEVASAVAESAQPIQPARRLSRRSDHDFYRLLSTSDPHDPTTGLRQLGRPGGAIPLRGQVEGSFSGRFSFYDFAAYRSMLVGRVASAYEGAVSDQLQVWRLEEHVVRLEDGKVEGGTGPIFDGGFEPDWKLANEERLLLPGEEPEADARYEILITGRGHSAWGSVRRHCHAHALIWAVLPARSRPIVGRNDHAAQALRCGRGPGASEPRRRSLIFAARAVAVPRLPHRRQQARRPLA